MSDYGVDDFFRAARDQREQLARQLDEIATRRKAHGQRVAAIEAQRAEVLAQLGRHILVDLTDASCERAGRLVAYAIDGAAARAALDTERAALTQQVAAAEADPRFADRAQGRRRLDAELVSAGEHRLELFRLLEQAYHPRLDRLLETGYGTDAYAVEWWRVSYYADWKAGDEILEKFPGRTEFGPLGRELAEARDLETSYAERIDAIRGEITGRDQLDQRHANAADRLANLDRLHLEAWQRALTDHVARLDPAGLADRLAGEPGAELLLKSATGLGKKLDYMAELARVQLDPLEPQVRADLAKLDRDLTKYRRPKHAWTRFPADVFDRRFRDRSDRFGKHWHRYDRAHDTLYGFDHYERASLVEEFLWWDLMTDGQIDGDFVREVHDFRTHHPDYRWESSSADDDAAAAASVAADHFDPSVSTSIDPS